jgi:hypothetical protein
VVRHQFVAAPRVVLLFQFAVGQRAGPVHVSAVQSQLQAKELAEQPHAVGVRQRPPVSVPLLPAAQQAENAHNPAREPPTPRPADHREPAAVHLARGQTQNRVPTLVQLIVMKRPLPYPLGGVLSQNLRLIRWYLCIQY